MRSLALLLLFSLACNDDDDDNASPLDAQIELDAAVTQEAGSLDVNSGAVDAGPEPLVPLYEIPGEDLFPEGIAFDPQTRQFFVGSLEHGSVSRIPGGAIVVEPPEEEGWRSLGLAVDSQARRLWICAEDREHGEIWAVEMSDWSRKRFSLEEVKANGRCNDLSVDPQGRVWITDPRNGAVYQGDIEAGLSLLLEDEQLNGTFPGLGPNGIVVAPDGESLILAVYKPSALFRLSLAGELSPIELSGESFGSDDPIIGADGLAFVGERLYVVFDDQVSQLEFSAPQRAVVLANLRHPAVDHGLSTAAEAEGALYLLKGEVSRYVTNRDPELPFQILRWPLGD